MTHKAAILGASGYTGAELIRLIATHPGLEIAALSADRKAGMAMAEVYPHLRQVDLPALQRIEELNFSNIDICFCALPHATSQAVISQLPEAVRVVDLSADFRLRDLEAYEKWYGKPHSAPELQKQAVYGLTEFYRDEIRDARLVAGTGCNAAAGQFSLIPAIRAGVIDLDEIIIDMKVGVSGAGRALKEHLLLAELGENWFPYSMGGKHRHLGEFDQEFSRAAGRPVEVQFTPTLVPAGRGILAASYVRGEPEAIHAALAAAYADEPFICVLPIGEVPAAKQVRATNFVHIGVVAERKPGRATIYAALDNLTKGSSGQALQNANLMLGHAETEGLMLSPVYP
ncbi:N-acetyl-gamma-glutamyl-phosphate reductase [Tropicimonas sp. IMCC6043]|uniref:N-acetyl-gamma-glutamyl-phosphate reductase n=1 Tax=Tropicimonas sp. IMCC6043 TaxID=2510645 RepID=UPI00101D7AA8|nr:N-acetyl-gamma-glutamyl-phosphate reductase [Tropicimonas sp. IMCC6043]RYH10142.1 N-acetyl-gamma-glutamyl-phosphate reductase [Tropicimonas sp. IMCC6043]